MTELLPLKREWFVGKENVDVIDASALSEVDVGEQVLQWVRQQTKRYSLD